MSDTRVLIVISKFYDEVSTLLLQGAIEALKQYKNPVEYDIVEVLGSFEIPAAIVFAIMSDRKKYDGYIALGCIIKGQTDHYYYVCKSVVSSISEIAIQHVVPLGFGVITADSMEKALVRADRQQKNIGGNAAKAALRMIELYKESLQ